MKSLQAHLTKRDISVVVTVACAVGCCVATTAAVKFEIEIDRLLHNQC